MLRCSPSSSPRTLASIPRLPASLNQTTGCKGSSLPLQQLEQEEGEEVENTVGQGKNFIAVPLHKPVARGLFTGVGIIYAITVVGQSTRCQQ